jgi:hypothetical protein
VRIRCTVFILMTNAPQARDAQTYRRLPVSGVLPGCICLPSPAALCRRNGKFRASSEQRKKARKSKKKVRREAWPLRPDLAPFLLLVKLRCFLSLAELCFRWGQPTGEHLRAAACGRCGTSFVQPKRCATYGSRFMILRLDIRHSAVHLDRKLAAFGTEREGW